MKTFSIFPQLNTPGFLCFKIPSNYLFKFSFSQTKNSFLQILSKMDTDIKPTLNSGSDTVHELISQFRSSFSYIELEKIISQRQQNMNQKLNELETKIEAVVKEKNLLFSENTKKQKKIEALTAANLAYKDQVKIFSPDKIRVLEKELKVKENEIKVLKKKNEDCEKKVKVYKKRFSDLDERVLLLEETAKEELKGFSTGFENIKQPKIGASESSRPPLSSEKGDSNTKTEPKFEDIIKLDDDDDDDDDDRCIRSAKRKWVSDSSDDEFISALTTKWVSKETERGRDGDKISAETQKMMKLDELNNQPMTCHPVSTPPSVGIGQKNLLSYFKISDSQSCQDIGKINEGNKSVIPKLKKRWECEEDMLKEFEKDDELCLDAILALHRQRIRVNAYDVSRVANLAKLLIDGDPEKKLKKRASELKQFDLEHCRMFAKEYSPKLFKIYQQKDDPFFPSASSK